MATVGSRFNGLIVNGLWGAHTTAYTGYRATALCALRLAYVVVRDIAEGQLTLRAMSLVYTTLLSFVPLLAVSFSVLKAFGVHNQVEPLLQNFLAPLGDKGEEISRNVITFIDNIKVGVLGAVGLALLIYTVVSLIQKIEGAFNFTWRIKRTRSFGQAFSDYLSVILVGPVLVFTAIGISATIMDTAVVHAMLKIEPFGTLAYVLSRLAPYVLVCAAFTFVYIFVPNIKVRFRAALGGGIFAGVAWEGTGWLFASFVVTSTRYEAIYSGFAIVIMFMIWLYVSWLILLIGAQVAFYLQHPHLASPVHRAERMGNRTREVLGLAVMYLIGEHHHFGRPRWTVDRLMERLGVDMDKVDKILDTLIAAALVIPTADEPPAFVPARDIGMITVHEIYRALRAGSSDGVSSTPKPSAELARVEKTVALTDAAVASALGDRTLKDLVTGAAEN